LVAGVALCAAGFVASLVTLYNGFVTLGLGGGTCASGGPFVVAHQCSSGEVRQLLVGLGGVWVCGGACFTAALGGPASAVGLLMWVGPFGLLGFGFLHGSGGLVAGIVFLLLAAGGLVPPLAGLLDWLANAGNPEPVAPGPMIVRATGRVPPAPSTVTTPGQVTNAAVPRRIVPPGRE
jgi:hypothetical protein